MGKHTAFLFDMDGTIADTMPFHVRAWMDFMHEFGIRMDPEDFLRKTSGKMNHQILREVLAIPVPNDDLEAFEERKEAKFRALCRPHLRPINGLGRFLDASRALGIRMAVATAAGKANREFVLDTLGLSPYFSAVVGPEDVKNGKPHPEIFLKAAARIDVDPASCIVFEDAVAGIEAAGRAGMRSVALATSLDAREFRGYPGVICTRTDYTGLGPHDLVSALTQ